MQEDAEHTEVDQEDYKQEEAIRIITKHLDSIKEKFKTLPPSKQFNLANKFGDKVTKSLRTQSGFMSALFTFGDFSGFNSKSRRGIGLTTNPRKRFRQGRIKGKSTAMGVGKRLVQKGRPSNQSKLKQKYSKVTKTAEPFDGRVKHGRPKKIDKHNVQAKVDEASYY